MSNENRKFAIIDFCNANNSLKFLNLSVQLLKLKK